LAAEYREQIRAAIPSFIEWFGDPNYPLWDLVTPMLADLAVHGKSAPHAGTTILTHGPDEFRETIGVTIPSFIKLLEKNSLRHKSTASLGIYNLSQSSEQDEQTCVSWLTRTQLHYALQSAHLSSVILFPL
jgi:hypothetical protein